MCSPEAGSAGVGLAAGGTTASPYGGGGAVSGSSAGAGFAASRGPPCHEDGAYAPRTSRPGRRAGCAASAADTAGGPETRPTGTTAVAAGPGVMRASASAAWMSSPGRRASGDRVSAAARGCAVADVSSGCRSGGSGAPASLSRGPLTVRESTAGAADDRARAVVSRAGGVVDLRDATVPEDGGRLRRCPFGCGFPMHDGTRRRRSVDVHLAPRRGSTARAAIACLAAPRRSVQRRPVASRPRAAWSERRPAARSVRQVAARPGGDARPLRCPALLRARARAARRRLLPEAPLRLPPATGSRVGPRVPACPEKRGSRAARAFRAPTCVASTAARSSVPLPDPTPRVLSVTLGAVTTGVVCDVRCTSVARAARTEVARTGTDGAVGLAGATCDASRVDSTRRSTAGDVDDEAAGTPGASAPRCGGSRPSTNGAASTAIVGSTSSSSATNRLECVARSGRAATVRPRQRRRAAADGVAAAGRSPPMSRRRTCDAVGCRAISTFSRVGTMVPFDTRGRLAVHLIPRR